MPGEYEYLGKKYIRVKANPDFAGFKFRLPNVSGIYRIATTFEYPVLTNLNTKTETFYSSDFIKNTTPTMSTIIANQSIKKSDTLNFTLANYFTDADGDTLTYTVTSSNTNVVSTSITNGKLTITPKAKGTSTIMIMVSDGISTLTKTFTVTVVNSAPKESTTLNSQTLVNKNATATITLGTYFTDIDGDALTYTATSKNSYVTPTISNGILTLTGKSKGTDTITITISDGTESITKTITVTVSNSKPTESTTLSNQILTNKNATTTITLGNHFTDIDGDSLTYTATSKNSYVTPTVLNGVLTLTGKSKGTDIITLVVSNGTINSKSG